MTPGAQNRVRAARLRAGLTQIDLALRAKISLATLYNAERGIATARTIGAIAAVLQVQPELLTEPPVLSAAQVQP